MQERNLRNLVQPLLTEYAETTNDDVASQGQQLRGTLTTSSPEGGRRADEMVPRARGEPSREAASQELSRWPRNEPS